MENGYLQISSWGKEYFISWQEYLDYAEKIQQLLGQQYLPDSGERRGRSMNNYFAMMSRMKYIDRWALMRNTRAENLSEHSLEVSMIAHALAVIGNTYLGKGAEYRTSGGAWHVP